MEKNREEASDIGGGNVIILPYQIVNPPRTVGIPTGSKGFGYTNLDIYKSIKYIEELWEHLYFVLLMMLK